MDILYYGNYQADIVDIDCDYVMWNNFFKPVAYY